MGPKTNRELLRDAVRDFEIEYDYNRIDSERLETLGDLADDFMAEQEKREAAVDLLTDEEIDRMIEEARGDC
jgi:hypothetical protein